MSLMRRRQLLSQLILSNMQCNHFHLNFWKWTFGISFPPAWGLSRAYGFIWYWLERPWSDDEMKVWLRDYPDDLKLFNPLQMHLTAAPQFKDGAIDPFPCRSGLFAADKGKDTVNRTSGCRKVPVISACKAFKA